MNDLNIDLIKFLREIDLECVFCVCLRQFGMSEVVDIWMNSLFNLMFKYSEQVPHYF